MFNNLAEFIEHHIAAGNFSPAARTREPFDVVDEYNEVNALDREDEDWMEYPYTLADFHAEGVHLAAALPFAIPKDSEFMRQYFATHSMRDDDAQKVVNAFFDGKAAARTAEYGRLNIA